jgi:DNA-binding CsgD family transcriptional regulator/PAS domain-containing protein
VTPREPLEGPWLAALHASKAPEQAYRALRGLFKERLGPSFAVLVLKALPGDPAVVFDGGFLGARERDFAEWLVRLHEPRQKRRSKVVLLSQLPDLRVPGGAAGLGGRLRAASALLAFDGCGFARALLLVGKPRAKALERADVSFLEALEPHVASVLEVMRARERERVTCLALQKLLGRLPVGVLLLDSDGSLLFKNPTAAEACARWNFGEEARSLNATRVFRLPREVVRASRALQSKRGSSPRLDSAVVESPLVEGLRAIVQPVRFDANPLSLSRCLVHFETTRPDPASPGGRLALLVRLTPRERELAELVGDGHGNAAVARQLGKSVHTVKKQLQAVFRKLGVERRSQLIAMLSR